MPQPVRFANKPLKLPKSLGSPSVSPPIWPNARQTPHASFGRRFLVMTQRPQRYAHDDGATELVFEANAVANVIPTRLQARLKGHIGRPKGPTPASPEQCAIELAIALRTELSARASSSACWSRTNRDRLDKKRATLTALDFTRQ
jgi:hypothetical protein